MNFCRRREHGGARARRRRCLLCDDGGPYVDGLRASRCEFKQPQRIFETTQNSASNDEIVGLVPALERFHEVAEPELRPRQSNDFLCYQAAHERESICLDRIYPRTGRLQHRSMAPFERAKLQHMATFK
jgi:hypothetical protein